MAQVAEEPQPTAARVFLRSAAGLHFRDAAAALATAGHLAFGRTVAVPAWVRAQSLLLLLLFTVVVGGGSTLAAAGAIRVIEDRSVPPPIEQPLPLPQVSPDPLPDVTLSPDVSPPSPPARDSAEQIDTGRDEPTPAARKGDEGGQDGPAREQDRDGGGESRQSGGKTGQPTRDGSGNGSGGTADDRTGDGGGRATPDAPEPAADGGPVKRDMTPLPDREQDARREP
jgi:hypothetical protein